MIIKLPLDTGELQADRSRLVEFLLFLEFLLADKKPVVNTPLTEGGKPSGPKLGVSLLEKINEEGEVITVFEDDLDMVVIQGEENRLLIFGSPKRTDVLQVCWGTMLVGVLAGGFQNTN